MHRNFSPCSGPLPDSSPTQSSVTGTGQLLSSVHERLLGYRLQLHEKNHKPPPAHTVASFTRRQSPTGDIFHDVSLAVFCGNIFHIKSLFADASQKSTTRPMAQRTIVIGSEELNSAIVPEWHGWRWMAVLLMLAPAADGQQLHWTWTPSESLGF